MRDVGKYVGNFRLTVDELQLSRGYILGLVGPNGSGKSTLIHILLGLIRPFKGEVEVLGLRQPRRELDIKQRVGYVSESPSFYEDMTVEWTTTFVSKFYRSWNDTECRHLMDFFRLDPAKKVKDLSKGMRVKLALKLALAHEPELLILDEPTSGLDPVARRQLLEEMLHIVQDERRSILLSSHITQDVEQIEGTQQNLRLLAGVADPAGGCRRGEIHRPHRRGRVANGVRMVPLSRRPLRPRHRRQALHRRRRLCHPLI